MLYTVQSKDLRGNITIGVSLLFCKLKNKTQTFPVE